MRGGEKLFMTLNEINELIAKIDKVKDKLAGMAQAEDPLCQDKRLGKAIYDLSEAINVLLKIKP